MHPECWVQVWSNEGPETSLPWGKAERMELFSLERRQLGGEVSSIYINMWREGTNKTETGSFEWGTATRGHGHKLKHRRFCLNVRKHFSIVEVTGHCQFAQGGLGSPPLEIFKKHLNIFLALGNTAWAEDMGQIISRSSLQPNNYVIVWVLWS